MSIVTGSRSPADSQAMAADDTTAAPPPEVALLQEYIGEITLRVEALPALQPRVIPTRSDSRWQRFLSAGRRRSFTLVRNFEIEVYGEAVPAGLRGRLVIPVSARGITNVFDGASIPLPWIVSYFSFGVLRPLGILLAASVVHDFAFQYGYLPVRRDGRDYEVPVARHDADELFRLIAATLNQSRIFSRLAWHAVRLGWWFIPYAGQKRTGRIPVRSTLLAVIASLAGVLAAVTIRNSWLASLGPLQALACLTGLLVTLMGAVYLWITVEQFRR